jgi:ribonuclease J
MKAGAADRINGTPSLDMRGGELYFVPLGGAGEIGMNLNLFGHKGKWLMVDLGVTFANDSTPGIEVIMPDPAFIEQRRKDLVGLVLTHAHEDHLGAVQYLWPRLKCPVYATPFTAAVLRAKLKDEGLAEPVEIREVPLGARFDIGPFAIELITLTHSIPEPNAVVIRTSAGTVLHTGDWKFDPSPMIGPVSDYDALRRVGDEGVLALVGDSTNVFVPGESGSEADVRRGLMELIGRFRQRVAVACFASNVARLESVARVAAEHGRHVALVGRSLWRIHDAAQATGYLKGLPKFLIAEDVGYLPRDSVLLLCTGSQGEPRSALARIAAGSHPQIVLEPGDAALFSSRVIPGNERSIALLQNQLHALGVEVVTAIEEPIHVSGHPARDELARMYQLVRPQIAVPVHGELRHLSEHARLAEACQVPQSVIVGNGSVVRLAPGRAALVGEVPSGRLAIDGSRLIRLDNAVMRTRSRIMHSGAAVATLVVDKEGRLKAEPQVTVHGLIDAAAEPEIAAELVAAVRAAVEKLPTITRRDDNQVKEAARIAVRRLMNASHGKKPVTDVHLIRV